MPRLALLALALALTPADSYNPAAVIPAEALQGDLLALRHVLEQSHPGLYRYTPKPAMDRAFAAASSRAGRAMDERAFYAIVTALLARIGDGHTRAYPSGDFRKYLGTSARRFPADLRLQGRRVIVVGGRCAPIPRGSEILGINGEPIGRIVDTMLAHISGDADILTGKYAAIGPGFATHYHMLVGYPRAFLVRYRDPAGKAGKATLMAITPAELKEEEYLDATPSRAPMRFELVDGSRVGRLTIETFALPAPDDGGPDVRKLLDSAFATMRGAGCQDLLIDLRGNDGGAPLGPLLFSYLTDRAVPFFDSVEAASVGFPLLHQYSHLDESFTDRITDHLISTDTPGRFRPIESPDLAPDPMPPQPDPFRGRVWVLIDGDVFSTAAQFCSVVRSRHRGEFIGEETGGAYHGCSAGELVVITLPATKLKVVIPLLRYEMAGADRSAARRGIVPEHPIAPTVEQLLGGEDGAMAYALGVIARRRGGS